MAIQGPTADGALVFTRPVEELWGHVRALEVPNLFLVARVVKTLVLAIFRWHLYEDLYVKLTTGFVYSTFRGVARVNEHHQLSFMKSAVCFKVRRPLVNAVNFEDLKRLGTLTPTTINNYFQTIHNVHLSDKRTLSYTDLVDSPLLERIILKL
jgi:hypothetical protein